MPKIFSCIHNHGNFSVDLHVSVTHLLLPRLVQDLNKVQIRSPHLSGMVGSRHILQCQNILLLSFFYLSATNKPTVTSVFHNDWQGVRKCETGQSCEEKFYLLHSANGSFLYRRFSLQSHTNTSALAVKETVCYQRSDRKIIANRWTLPLLPLQIFTRSGTAGLICTKWSILQPVWQRLSFLLPIL